jgi:uncharacterized protein (TIGR02145 family)
MKRRAFFLIAAWIAAPAAVAQVKYVAVVETEVDAASGAKIRTVTIGTKRWMAENLNIKTEGSWCYDNKESNCDKYGRLYNWNAAMRACPSGLHLPTRQDWNDLVKSAGGRKAGKALKSSSGWSRGGNGTDAYGFTALPGGGRLTAGSFDNAGGYGYWWTATGYGSGYAYNREMGYDYDDVYELDSDKNNGFSVRCVGD